MNSYSELLHTVLSNPRVYIARGEPGHLPGEEPAPSINVLIGTTTQGTTMRLAILESLSRSTRLFVEDVDDIDNIDYSNRPRRLMDFSPDSYSTRMYGFTDLHCQKFIKTNKSISSLNSFCKRLYKDFSKLLECKASDFKEEYSEFLILMPDKLNAVIKSVPSTLVKNIDIKAIENICCEINDCIKRLQFGQIHEILQKNKSVIEKLQNKVPFVTKEQEKEAWKESIGVVDIVATDNNSGKCCNICYNNLANAKINCQCKETLFCGSCIVDHFCSSSTQHCPYCRESYEASDIYILSDQQIVEKSKD